MEIIDVFNNEVKIGEFEVGSDGDYTRLSFKPLSGIQVIKEYLNYHYDYNVILEESSGSQYKVVIKRTMSRDDNFEPKYNGYYIEKTKDY